ncbi:receptor-like protein 53 [Panicum hallii]|uniref:receptor-like protein 53 n=1 Tax=Panicum hallii TaxID=206008 RepID=UPI000DF4DDFE|nr:receptor-like protein 53 [Panicum hallii]
MAPTKEHLHSLMHLFIACLLKLSTAAPCLPDQASSLLQLKASFIGDSLPSWQAGTDCCHHWEGVTCDVAFGRVISLDLGEFDLMSSWLDPALFNLTSLRNLSLAFNDFRGASLPASGFERLTDIIHLNLSCTYFLGQIPIGIACLKNLVTLDLSENYDLYFERPSFKTFMANMSNLRELYLDGVNLSSSGSTWSTVLADSVPQLQVLSLYQCYISGPIQPSFSRLRSLTTINLGYNKFEGHFPTKIFQLKSLRTLDLSGNPMLSVRLTHFPAGNNLETLNLAGTNFSCDMPSSFGNLEYVKTLGLNMMGIDDELPSLISKLPLLDDLQLMGPDTENPILSWISNITQLTHLLFDGYDFSKSIPTWIGKLTRLESLTIADCSFSMPIPYQIGNLTKLVELKFLNCDFSEQRMPSSIGNLTKLVLLSICDCNFSGPIPSTIGNLIQLEKLVVWSSHIGGKIPKSLFALPALQVLFLLDNQLIGSLEDIPAPLSSPLREILLSSTIELGSIWRLRNLTHLSLGNNMISLTEKEVLMDFKEAYRYHQLHPN